MPVIAGIFFGFGFVLNLFLNERRKKIENIYIEYSIKWEKEVYFKQKQMPRSMNIQTENKHVSVAVTNVK